MRKLALAIALVLAVATLALAGPKGKKYKEHTIHGFNYDKHAVERLLDDSGVPGEVTAYDDGVREVKGKFRLDRNKPVEEAAVDFIDKHRNAFKLKDPKKELKKDHREGLRYKQIYNGVPVWGHSLSVHLNQDFDVTLIMSDLVPSPDIDTTPLLTEEEAVDIARTDLQLPSDAVILPPTKKLVIYNNKLAYEIGIESFLYFIDAKNGEVINKRDITVY